MKKLIVAAASLAVALVGFGALGTGPSTTHAAPTSIVVANCSIIMALAPAADCTDGNFTSTDTTALDTAIGNGTAPLTAAELSTVTDLSAPQVGNTELVLFAFVNDDSDVTFDTGTTLSINGAGDYACAAGDPTDEDCNNDNVAGDGVVAVVVTPQAGAAVGDTQSITVTQGTVSDTSDDIMVVGAPHDVAVDPATATVQADSTDACKATDAASPDLDQAALAANVTDSDGNALVGIPVDWASSAATTVKVDAAALPPDDTAVKAQSFTVNSSAGINAFAVACGLKVGSADVSATINSGAVNEDTASATVTVVGAPASITLAANPAAIACTGTSTSTVTATVKDSGGNNVVNGTTVTFSVVALGTANPINATTTDGVATSVITPLSGNTAGTIVNVSAGSAAASLRIDCLPSLATATAAAGATATPVGGIVGPNTGTGGYLGQDSGSSFPMWALAALALGSLVLVGGGIAARRAGK